MHLTQQQELDHAKKRVRELQDWILAHSYTHPNWDRNVSDLNLANLRVHKLSEKKTAAMQQSPIEYSIPNKR